MKPHCLILYVGRLKQIFEAAGTPLQSVMANNCFGLNSRPGHHLYKEDVNLLDFVGKCPSHQRIHALGVWAAQLYAAVVPHRALLFAGRRQV